MVVRRGGAVKHPAWVIIAQTNNTSQFKSLSFSQAADYQAFKQPVQLSNCVPFPQSIEHQQCGETIPSSNIIADLSSADVWWLNQDVAPGCAAITSEDILPQTNLESGSDAQIKNAVMSGELQELKRAVNTLTDRCKALTETVPKLRNG